ncbi:MAG: hypothetical protein WBJ13_13625 [Sedimentibacter sp.]
MSTIRKNLILLTIVLLGLILTACYGEKTGNLEESSMSIQEDVSEQSSLPSQEDVSEQSATPSQEDKTDTVQNSSGNSTEVEEETLEEVYSMLKNLEEVMGSLEDVNIEELEIPNP